MFEKIKKLGITPIEIAIIIVIIALLFAVVPGIIELDNQVEEKGLRSIVEDIWYGEEGPNGGSGAE